jgi:arsenate reductase (thioredoxin)
MKKILFLSSANACRSIIAEALVNHLASKHFHAFSAGSFPAGKIHAPVAAILKENGMDAAGYRSKSWHEFMATPMDFIVYLCDKAAGELCPEFSGHPVRAHWCQPDIFQVHQHDPLARMSFEDVYESLEMRIRAFLRLPLDCMNRDEMVQKLYEIGKLEHDRRSLRFIHPAVLAPRQ